MLTEAVRFPVFIFILLVFSSGMMAQGLEMTGKHHIQPVSEVGFSGKYVIGSPSISRAFQNAWIHASFIDSSMKEECLRKMTGKSRIGSIATSKAWFIHYQPDTVNGSESHYGFGVGQRTLFGCVFPEDLFRLYFNGNKSMAGRTADIGHFHYASISYQYLSFEWGNSIPAGSDLLEYQMGLSAINGSQYLKIKTSNGSIYTQEDGEYLDLLLDLQAEQSDTSRKEVLSPNGIGGSVDLSLAYIRPGKFSIRAGVSHLGMMAWNSHAYSFSVDTNYHYEGITVENLLDSLYLDITNETDFKEGFIEDQNTGSFTRTLPFTADISFAIFKLQQRLELTLSGSYVQIAGYMPSASISGYYRFSHQTGAGLELSAGGFSDWSYQMHVSHELFNTLIISLSVVSPHGLFTSHDVTDQGAGIKAAYRF